MLTAVKDLVRQVGPVYRTINRVRGFRIHEPNATVPRLVRIGSSYGGWSIDRDRLTPASIVYAVGVGEDISFDLGLIDAVGCEVHAFDPTPIAVGWIAKQALPAKFHFHAVGLGAEDGEVEFQVPGVDGYHSFSLSAAPEAAVRGSVACPIRRLSTIMRDLGHDRIDLLKMDIEGFEYSVVDDMIASGVRPSQLLIEYHHLMYTYGSGDTKRSVRALLEHGYDLVWVSDVGHEYAFVARDRPHDG